METNKIKDIDYMFLPSTPGVYKYFNSKKELIYVGKAKNLKKRVSSYFTNKTGLNLKTRKLISEVSYIDYIVVDTEYDALLLENNLIKENRPKYNILLKDDKSFPFICVSNERFPKIYSTRQKEEKTGEYFGPYTSVKAMNNVLILICSLYKIRTCQYALTAINIEQNKFKVCLEYHVGNCLGPCEGLQSETEYLSEIEQAKNILKGKLQVVKNNFTSQMTMASNAMNFEEAQLYKNKIESLEQFQSKTVIVSNHIKNTDVITIISDEFEAYVNYMRVDNGIITVSETITIKKKLEEIDEELLQIVIINARSKFDSNSPTILTNKQFPTWSKDVDIIVPQIGDKKTIVNLSLKNALTHKKETITTRSEKTTNNDRILQQLQSDLKLPELPLHIECFDNSNLQGSNPVASMVCFKNGRPSKKDYRHFNIKTVIGADDFKSMNEIVTRRYKRLLEEKQDLPKLIIVDGGKGQLGAACDALKELKIYGQIPIIGIAKRLEEIYYPEDNIPIHLSKKSTSLRLIQQLRDEAHRFAITFHRNKRSNATITSELDNIDGIGPKTKTILLSQFKSWKSIKTAKPETLTSLIGKAKTDQILDYIKKGA